MPFDSFSWRQFIPISMGGQYVTTPYFISLATIYNYSYWTTRYDDAFLHLTGWKLVKRIFLHILSPATIYVFWWQYMLYDFTYIVGCDNLCRTTIYAVTQLDASGYVCKSYLSTVTKRESMCLATWIQALQYTVTKHTRMCLATWIQDYSETPSQAWEWWTYRANMP